MLQTSRLYKLLIVGETLSELRWYYRTSMMASRSCNATTELTRTVCPVCFEVNILNIMLTLVVQASFFQLSVGYMKNQFLPGSIYMHNSKCCKKCLQLCNCSPPGAEFYAEWRCRECFNGRKLWLGQEAAISTKLSTSVVQWPVFCEFKQAEKFVNEYNNDKTSDKVSAWVPGTIWS